MAFVGHPILADIRKGFRLRPTQTVDKSKPIILAEGEQISELNPNSSPSPALLPQGENNNRLPRGTTAPQAKGTTAPQTTQQRNEAKKRIETKTANPSPKGIGGQSVSVDQRQKMLAQIRAGGVHLRHVQTVDKSGLILEEQQQQNCAVGTRIDAVSPNSLDSQGKSPSPRTTPSSSSASAFSPTPITAGESGVCWHRTLSDDLSDSVPSMMMNGCDPAESLRRQHSGQSEEHFGHHSRPLDCRPNCRHHNHHPADQCSSHSHDQNAQRLQRQRLPSPQFLAAIPSSSTLPTSKLGITSPATWKQPQGTTVIRLGGTALGGDNGQQKPKGNSDFQFDEQKQILERRAEVAALCAQRATNAKLVAFQKLQQRQTESVASSFCTLPRNTKAQHKHWHAKVASSESSANARQLVQSHWAVPTLAAGTKERDEENCRKDQSSADWHGTKWPQAQTTAKNEHHHHTFNGQQNANAPPNTKLRCHSPSPQRRNGEAPLSHRSASSSNTNFAFAEQPAPSQHSVNVRPFGQRVSAGGGAHRQHFERIRDRFEDAEKRNGTERSAELLWKRAAEERKGGGESEGSAKAEVFANGAHSGQEHRRKSHPPPLPNSSPPEIRPQKMRPFAASPSPFPSREIIRLKTPTNGIDLRDLQKLDGAQLALLRTNFKFAIDLDNGTEGERLIRIVRR